MPPSIRGLAIILVLALNACGTLQNASPTPSSTPLSTLSPLPTEPDDAPAATVTAAPTDSPTAVPTPGIVGLQDDSIKKQVDQLASWFVGQGTNSGMGVSVVLRNPQTGQLEVLELTYGTLGKGDGLQVTPDTIYEIGSITKVFTGILLAEDVASGKVQLDDPIQKYLPDGIQAPSYEGIPITLDELATHRSGLPRDINTDTPSEMYGWLNGFQLSRAPGSEYVYSNVGFSLLGDILARLSGTDFNTLESQAVSAPLGLSDTGEKMDADKTDRLAQGYTSDGSPAQYFPDSGAMSSAGYMRSTLDDMTRFLVDNMQPDSTPLAASIQMAQTLQAEGRNPGTGVGLGWEIDQLGTTSERLYKGGGTYGFTSYISFMRDGSSGFVLMTNGPNAENLVPHMLNIINSSR